MPEISMFGGIRITMYYDDHNPPHFHADYAGNRALVDIQGGYVIGGALCTAAESDCAADVREVDGMDYQASVVQALPGENFTVYIYFSDGSVRKADMKPFIGRGGVFARLGDELFFRERLTVMNGTVAWDVTGTRDATQCIDFDPCVMYEKSPIVTDPLQSA